VSAYRRKKTEHCPIKVQNAQKILSHFVQKAKFKKWLRLPLAYFKFYQYNLAEWN